VVTDGVDTSIAVVNAFAPEHLAVMTDDPWTLLPRIRHAGEILMGDYPIISLGNYAMGGQCDPAHRRRGPHALVRERAGFSQAFQRGFRDADGIR
jgi:hypothetical protein